MDFSATRDDMPGTLTLADPLIWSDEERREVVALSELTELSAAPDRMLAPFGLLAGFILGMLLAAEVRPGMLVAAAWAWAAVLELVILRFGGVTVAIATERGRFEVKVPDRRAFGAVGALRRPMRLDQAGISELMADAFTKLRSPDPNLPERAQRIIGAWTIGWTLGAPTLFGTVVAAVCAATGVLSVSGALAMVALMPPLTSVFWPITAIPGLLMQGLLVGVLARLAGLERT